MEPSLRSLTLSRSIAFEAVHVSNCWSFLNTPLDSMELEVRLGMVCSPL